MHRKKLVVALIAVLVTACTLCAIIFFFGNRLTVLYSSLTSKRLATIDLQIWDNAGQPDVLVSGQLNSSEYDLGRVTALAILLLAEDQMRVMSSESQNLLESGLQEVVRRFEEGEIKPPTFNGQRSDAHQVGTFRIIVFKRRRPFLINMPPIFFRFDPRWASDIEEACAIAIPLFAEHELGLLSSEAKSFVIKGLRLQLERWEEDRPKQFNYSYDWEYLSSWNLRR